MAPDLNAALASIFTTRPITIRRKPTAYVTTFPCEVVTCRLDSGKNLGLFCKYESEDGSCSYGQRRGVRYEAEVYRRVLQPSGFSTPRFYGSYTDQDSGGTWLIVEYLKRSLRAGKVPNLKAMKAAARWIGRFHAAHEASAADNSVAFLTQCDAGWYRAWARRASRSARHHGLRVPWLAGSWRSLEDAVTGLAMLPRTVIHGEYYSHNIMFQRGMIRPVDWETGAVAPGEIDVATLTEGWSVTEVRELEAEYQQSRWPAGAPGDFARNLDLARAYIQLRWLGDDDRKQATNMARWTRLRDLGRRLDIIPKKEGA